MAPHAMNYFWSTCNGFSFCSPTSHCIPGLFLRKLCGWVLSRFSSPFLPFTLMLIPALQKAVFH